MTGKNMNSRVIPLGVNSGAISLNVIIYLESLWQSRHLMNNSYYYYYIILLCLQILHFIVERIRFTAFTWNNIKVAACSMLFVIQGNFPPMGDVQQVLFSVLPCSDQTGCERCWISPVKPCQATWHLDCVSNTVMCPEWCLRETDLVFLFCSSLMQPAMF